MRENIYSKISKETGRDMRHIRIVAHHPFEFFTKRMIDMQDHRPMRFRYLGAFLPKVNWRKGLANVTKIGYPEANADIWAKVPEAKFNKTYMNLKQGTISEDGNTFTANDNSVVCSTKEIGFWVPSNRTNVMEQL